MCGLDDADHGVQRREDTYVVRVLGEDAVLGGGVDLARDLGEACGSCWCSQFHHHHHHHHQGLSSQTAEYTPPDMMTACVGYEGLLREWTDEVERERCGGGLDRGGDGYLSGWRVGRELVKSGALAKPHVTTAEATADGEGVSAAEERGLTSLSRPRPECEGGVNE